VNPLSYQQLEQMLKKLAASVQSVMQSGEVLSDEFQGELAKTFALIRTRMDEARQQEQPATAEPTPETQGTQPTPETARGAQPTGEQIPGLEAAPYESSNINAFRYDPRNQKLFVKFQGKYPQQNGPVYSYEGVPSHIFDVFRRGAVAPKTSGRNAWHTWKEGVSPSHGASMYALIKQGGYSYKRLS
jgi:hypothetical protein